MRRSSLLQTSDNIIDRYINDDYTKILEVAGSTTAVVTVADSIGTVSTVADSITSINTTASHIEEVAHYANTYVVDSVEPSTLLFNGKLWFDTLNSVLKVYSEVSGWLDTGSSVNGVLETTEYVVGTPSGDYDGVSLNTFPCTYDVGYVHAYRQGFKLDEGSFTADDGDYVSFNVDAHVGDTVSFISFGSFRLSNVYTTIQVDDALGLKANQSAVYTIEEVDLELASKADQSAVYTIGEVDSALALKADQSTTYTTTQINDALVLKANQATTYTVTEVDSAMALKANQATTYTSTQVDDALLLKADQSTTYTITEIDNALVLKANQSSTYTIAEVDSALSGKVATSQVLTNVPANALFTDTIYDDTSLSALVGSKVTIGSGDGSKFLADDGNYVTVVESKVAMPANDIDAAAGGLFTKTISSTTTLTVSNVPPNNITTSFILELTNGGSNVITWWSGIKWSGGTVPTLTATGVDILGFYSHDNGVTWRGIVLSKDSK